VTKIQKSIEVERPLSTVYNQWTQFEEFPKFMEGVEQVTQLDDKRLHWVGEVGGRRKEWDALITEQVPDRIVAWRSEDGTANGGYVSFAPLDDDHTRVMLEMEYEPEDLKETVGDALGFVSRQVSADLERFKEFIEERGVETGAWRGTIRDY
jgi:uncharacterized membrane protein